MPQTTPPPVSQPVTAALTPSAIFLVLTVNAGREAEETVRGVCADLSSLKRGVGFRNLKGQLTCVMGIGSDLWDRLFGAPRPKHLHPMREIRGVHFAPSTPGDILFHIRSTRLDMCFELATAIMDRLSGAVETMDEVHGFKFFDERDLLGFVDGTENPVAQAAFDATIIGADDPDFVGGSYVIIQKYLHDLKGWNRLAVETQEDIIGRAKLSDIEQLESRKKPFAHNVLTSINDANGQALQILRDNMPFGEVGKGEFGTFFIGYARDPAVTERMLDNMFIGSPPGNYDRLLDFSVAATGCLFFVPTATFLDDVTTGPWRVRVDRANRRLRARHRAGLFDRLPRPHRQGRRALFPGIVHIPGADIRSLGRSHRRLATANTIGMQALEAIMTEKQGREDYRYLKTALVVAIAALVVVISGVLLFSGT